MNMNIIEHVIEPKKLLVCWQPPEGTNRTRYIIGELTKKNSTVAFQYNINSKDLEDAKKLGFDGYPAFKQLDKEYTEGVMETFSRRVPPKSRGDYNKYLTLFRLPTDTVISDFSLLGYTGAKLPTDGFSIINPFYNLQEPCEFLMEIAGFRYSELDVEDLRIGDRVSIKKEPDNPFDNRAIRIDYKGEKIGYINRGIVETFHDWIDTKAKLYISIERVNGHPVRPIVYLFVKIKPKSINK